MATPVVNVSDDSSAPAEPLPIVVMTCGVEDKWEKQLVNTAWRNQREFEVTDLRLVLHRDPKKGGIGHHEGADSFQTRKAVIRQENFGDMVVDWLARITASQPKRIPKKTLDHCQSGWHRAMVAGCMKKAWANQLVDSHGNRLFNCQHFSAVQCYGKGDKDAMWDSADDWGSPDWPVTMSRTVNETWPLSSNSSFFGWDAASIDPEAHKQCRMGALYTWFTDYCPRKSVRHSRLSYRHITHCTCIVICMIDTPLTMQL
jgi:hypothetical protein